MAKLKPEYHDREILEQVAQVEANNRPYDYSVTGVEAEDIWDHFRGNYFDTAPEIMIPNRLKWLSESGYLHQVYPNRSSANAAYRLTHRGWQIVDQKEPSGPVEER